MFASPRSTDFRVVSYNVKDLGREMDDTPAPDGKIRALAATLDAIGGDFVGIQEIGSYSALTLLNTSLRRPFAWSQLVEGNSTRKQHFGYLSRYPVSITSHSKIDLSRPDGTSLIEQIKAVDGSPPRTKTLRFQRDLMLADVNTPGGRIGIFVLHLKSMRSESNTLFPENPTQDDIRTAESHTAKLVVDRFRADNPDRPVLIIGDFNATCTMNSLQPLLSDVEFVDILQRDWIETGNHPVYSYRNRPAKARLDYLLLSKHALALYAPGSARIHRTANRKASDHLPVSVDLQFAR